MSPNDLREEIAIELEAMKQTLDELTALLHDVTGRQATTRELAAAGLFLANLYNAVENILKRICKYHGVDIPAGPNWHMELARSLRISKRSTQPYEKNKGFVQAAHGLQALMTLAPKYTFEVD